MYADAVTPEDPKMLVVRPVKTERGVGHLAFGLLRSYEIAARATVVRGVPAGAGDAAMFLGPGTRPGGTRPAPIVTPPEEDGDE